MHKIKDLLKEEIECYEEKKELSRSDVEPLHQMVATYKDLCEICEKEGFNSPPDVSMGWFYLLMLSLLSNNSFNGYSSEHSGYDYPIEGSFGINVANKGYGPGRSGKPGMRQGGMRNPNGGYDRRTQNGMDWHNDNLMDDTAIDMRFDGSYQRGVGNAPYYNPKSYMNNPGMNGMKNGMADRKEKAEFTHADAKEWLAAMENADGSTGAHFPLDKTTAVAKQLGIAFGDKFTDWEFNVVMNMMYSDYCKTAQKFGVDKPEYYAMLAKDFLMDDDSVDAKEKIAAYFDGIVKPAM